MEMLICPTCKQMQLHTNETLAVETKHINRLECKDCKTPYLEMERYELSQLKWPNWKKVIINY